MKLTAKEILLSAEINFQTFQKTYINVTKHPIFILAMNQLKDGIAALKKESENPHQRTRR